MEFQEVKEKIDTLAKWVGESQNIVFFRRSWGFDRKRDPRLPQRRWPLSPKV